MTQTINYDYEGLKDAHAKLTAVIETFESETKTIAQAGDELIEGNTAPGVRSTMTALQEKQTAVLGIMKDNLEIIGKALDNARELHVASGGEA